MHKNDKHPSRPSLLAAVLQQGAAPFAPLALFGDDNRPRFAPHADPRRHGVPRQNQVRRRGPR
jgi:hypothetical protein